MEPVKVFYSYAHEDRTLREELGKHLASLRYSGLCEDWHDGEICPGSEWDEDIKTKLRSADFILLLISADFLASTYVRAVELKESMERHERKEARVVPIVLRPCEYTGEIFCKLQGLPAEMKAVTLWESLDEGLVDVAKGLRREFERFRSGRQTGAATAPPTAPEVVVGSPVAPPAGGAPEPTPGTAALPTAARADGLPPGERLLETQEKNRALAHASKEMFHGLRELMASPKIKAFVAEQGPKLMAADEALQVLVAYKDVHDRLHDLQFQCYNYIVQEARRAEDQIEWRLLDQPKKDLQGIIDSLAAAAKHSAMADENFSWLDQLTEAQERLTKAYDELSLSPLIEAGQKIKTILEMRPPIFDTKLCAVAKTLPLDDLQEALSKIEGKLSRTALAREAGVKFSAGVQALPELSRSLQMLTTEHGRWQVIATMLWSINALIDQDLKELQKNWARLRDRLGKLCAENSSPWAVTIMAAAGKLDGLLQQPVPEDTKERRRWETKVRQSYQSCSNDGETRFYQVDVSLLELCHQLRGIHTALGETLQELP